MLLLLGAAWAADTDQPASSPIGVYRPAGGNAPPDWLVRSGTIWLRDADLCFPVRAEDASHLWFMARVCEDGSDQLVCNARFGLAEGWEWRDEDCRLGLTGPEGTRTSQTPEPHGVLIAVDDKTATWAPDVPLKAVVGKAMTEVHPCEPESLAALTKEAKKAVGRDTAALTAYLADRNVVDGTHRCDASEGATAVVMGPTATRSVVPGTRTVSSPVDCRSACPTATGTTSTAALAAVLASHHWYDPDAATTRLYATRNECLASPAGPAHIDRDLCNTLGGQLRAQAH